MLYTRLLAKLTQPTPHQRVNCWRVGIFPSGTAKLADCAVL